MKIFTITCHKVYNYGASLQAFALQSYLVSLGQDVNIIDFTPDYQNVKYNFWYVPFDSKYNKLFVVFPFLKFFYCLLKNYKQFFFRKRKWAFDDFTSRYLTLTQFNYRTSDELKRNPPHADIYIAGSDQIWNTFVPNGLEPAYYLCFGKKNIRRLAYAASFGTSKLKSNTEGFVKSNLANFNQISVRESSGINLCKSLGFDCVKVLDPVFLMEASFWDEILTRSRKYPFINEDKYILVYDFIYDNSIKLFAKETQNKLGSPIVSVNDYLKIDYADYNINDAGPLEFLYLIKNASIIICNSFHALAFSVIFKKEFYVFSLSGFNNSSRMADFLGDINCLDRYNSNKLALKNINYSNIDNYLSEMIKTSRQYLSSNIQ